MAEKIQTSFTAGELAPSLHGHVDLDKYQTGLKTCRNFIVQAHGGVINRPGLQFIGSSKDSSKLARLIPFEFSITQTYALEFGDLYMRVIKDGGHVLESSKTITGATQANPVVITTSAAHGYSNGDEVYIDGVVGMTELNGKRYIVANVAATTFELTGIDGTGYTAYSSGGTVARIFTLTTPYLEADLFRLNYDQSADVMTLTHPSYQQRDLTRTAHDAWTLTTISFTPEQGAPTGVTVTPAVAGPSTIKYKVTAIADETFEESLAASGQTAAGTLPVNSTNYNTISWTAPAAGTIDKYNIYREHNGLFSYCGSVDGANTSFVDSVVTPDPDLRPPTLRDPFTSASNYPGAMTYFEQRKVFAGTNNDPQKSWLTQVGNFFNMNYSSPIKDDDAFSYTLNSLQVNQIRHIVPIEDLIYLTSGSIWRVGSGESPFTATTVQVRQQSSVGSSYVKPLLINNSILYIQDKVNNVRDLQYARDTNRYGGDDLSLLANHLFEGYTVTDWAFAEVPFKVVWTIRNDGILLGLTYNKEQNLWAWHKHDTDGYFESVCSIREGNEDAVYFVVRRTINGTTKRYIERFSTRTFATIEDAFIVDSGLSVNAPVTVSGATQANPVVITATGHGFSNGDRIRFTHVVGMTELNQNYYLVGNKTANTFELQDLRGDNIDGTGFTAYASGGEVRKCVTTISGLEHLEGKTLAILGDGSVQPPRTVSDGSVTLQNPVSEIHYGLGYYSDLETLDMALQIEGYGQAKYKKPSHLTIKVDRSRGFWAGNSETTITEYKQRTDEQMGHPTRLATGIQEIVLDPAWNSHGRIFIRQVDPLPISILAVVPGFDIGD